MAWYLRFLDVRRRSQKGLEGSFDEFRMIVADRSLEVGPSFLDFLMEPPENKFNGSPSRTSQVLYGSIC